MRLCIVPNTNSSLTAVGLVLMMKLKMQLQENQTLMAGAPKFFAPTAAAI